MWTLCESQRYRCNGRTDSARARKRNYLDTPSGIGAPNRRELLRRAFEQYAVNLLAQEVVNAQSSVLWVSLYRRSQESGLVSLSIYTWMLTRGMTFSESSRVVLWEDTFVISILTFPTPLFCCEVSIAILLDPRDSPRPHWSRTCYCAFLFCRYVHHHSIGDDCSDW